MTDHRDATVLIPVCNRRDSLTATLLSLVHQSIGREAFDVVVADNGSGDGIADLVAEFRGRLHVQHVVVPKVKPFESCRVRNRGLEACRGRVVVFLDSDMIVPRTFLSNHLLYHRGSDAVAVLGKMIYLERNDPSLREVVAHDFGADDLGPHQVVGNTVHRFLALSGNLAQYDRPWQFCIGANFSVGRETIHKVGGFDEDLDGDLPSGGDVAYGMKLHAAGVRLVYGRWALGFHQRNHPLSVGEAPEYFGRRTASVRRHEGALHLRYSLEDAYARLLRKRRITRGLQRAGLNYTHSAARRLLPRHVRHGCVDAPEPLLSVLLVQNGSPERLREILHEIAAAPVGPDTFEVIVLDATAPVDDDECVPGSPSEAVVQLADVPFLVRYYPTGTEAYRSRVSAIDDTLRRDGLTERERDLLRRERVTVQRSYRRTMTALLEERPLGVVSRIASVRDCDDPACLIATSVEAVARVSGM